MRAGLNNVVRNALSIAALVIPLAALQCPLWLPADTPLCVTTKAGGTVLFDYDRDIAKATILERRTATVSAAGARQLVIHGKAPGRTRLIIRYKDGQNRLYEVVVQPG